MKPLVKASTRLDQTADALDAVGLWARREENPPEVRRRFRATFRRQPLDRRIPQSL